MKFFPVLLCLALTVSAVRGYKLIGDFNHQNMNKTGTCPDVMINTECPAAIHIKNVCLVDGHCPGLTKCCADGCQLKCLQPKQVVAPKGPGSTVKSKERYEAALMVSSMTNYNGQKPQGGFNHLDMKNKPGICPEVMIATKCPPTIYIKNVCLLDGQCPGLTKCCSADGCHLKCLQPKQVVVPKACIPVDLGFLIDASGSIDEKTFGKVKEFVKRIVDAFDVGEEGTHVGVIWFSDTAKLAFSFKNFTDTDVKANIFKAVDSIQKTTHLTRIDRGLRLAYSDLYSIKGGVRFDKPKILLVMTDGRQTRGPNAPDAQDLDVASKPLKESGVQVYSIGIGRDYNINELLAIASDDTNVYTVEIFDELLFHLARKYSDKLL